MKLTIDRVSVLQTVGASVTVSERRAGASSFSTARWEKRKTTMHVVTVRPAVVSEQRQLEALQWRASLENPGDRQALLQNPDAITLPLEQIEQGGVLVAEVAGIVAGFAAILPRQDGDSELDALFVEPAIWRQGVGRVLIEHCCTAARAAGAAVLHVVGNPHAEAFYRTCGFEQRGTSQTRFGIGLLMQRKLR